VVALDALLREAFYVCAVLALPAVIVATIVGTAVAVVQAATQVHEQTLTLLPKLLAIGALVALFGAFGMRLCATLFTSALTSIPRLVYGQ
jgi:flagellar biosynthesis protein FliQ